VFLYGFCVGAASCLVCGRSEGFKIREIADPEYTMTSVGSKPIIYYLDPIFSENRQGPILTGLRNFRLKMAVIVGLRRN